MGDFDLDTRVEGGEGRYRAELSQDWEIWGPNGGYLAAIALRAAGREASIQRPASFSGHFLRVARFARVDLDVELLRRGRRTESIQVSMRQDGRPVLHALVRTAKDGPGLEHDRARPPEVPDPEGLKSWQDLDPEATATYPFWQNLEEKLLRADVAQREHTPQDPVWLRWYRFRPRATFDDPFVDAARLLLLIDTLSWPAACMPHVDHDFQAPNLDVSAWFHRLAPESEWLLADHEAPVAEAGLMGSTGRVWSRDRRLLASGGAQLLCVPAMPHA